MTATSKYHPYLRVSRRLDTIYNIAREKLDNTTHVSHEGTTSGHSSRQRSKSRAESHLSLVHIFHAIPHAGLSVGDAYTILIYITVGDVRDRPTQ
jgi:hypothetical protein